MPPPVKPARLLLRQRDGRPAVYVILDRGREVSTGFGPTDQREAEKALAAHVAAKHRPAFGNGEPAQVAVADVLTHYLESLRDDHSGPEPYHVDRLLEGFGDLTCADVTPDQCRAYVAARMAGEIGKRRVVAATARRELETFAAALNRAHRDRKLDRHIPLIKPEGSDPRDRWLTRDEAARLVRGALGFSPTGLDANGAATGWKRVSAPQYHVARFILICLYTATRHASVLDLRWERHSTAGSIDFQTMTLYRRGRTARETRKRRPPCRIPNRLIPHLARWKRLTVHGPCEYAGEIIQRQKTGFGRARRLALLGEDVTPHVLKHSCVTWLLQRGVSTWDVAGFTGTSEKTIRETYGHHSPDHMAHASMAFSRKPI